MLVYAANGGARSGDIETARAGQLAAKQAVYETMIKMAPHFSTTWTLKTMLPLLAHIDNCEFDAVASVAAPNNQANTNAAGVGCPFVSQLRE